MITTTNEIDAAAPAGKRPLARARDDAEAFRALFPSACYLRWEIAGSVRRGVSECGDVDHVVIPVFGEIPAAGDLFGRTERVNLLWFHLDALAKSGVEVRKHLYTIHRKDGGTSVTPKWGDAQRGVEFRGAKHEVWTAGADNWGAQLAIRTGPGPFSKMLVNALQRNGYVNADGYVEDKRRISCVCSWSGAWGDLTFDASPPPGTRVKWTNGNDAAALCPRCRQGDGLTAARVAGGVRGRRADPGLPARPRRRAALRAAAAGPRGRPPRPRRGRQGGPAARADAGGVAGDGEALLRHGPRVLRARDRRAGDAVPGGAAADGGGRRQTKEVVMAAKTKIAKPVNVKDEVRRLEQRLDGLESIARLQHVVQVESLAKAETLRKLALYVVNGRKLPKDDHAGVRLADRRRFDELAAFVNGLERFHKPVRMPAAVRRLLAGRKRS
jgi:hypothetical protein